MLVVSSSGPVLTEAQREVVESSGGRRVFLGGPGAGKTLSLGERAVRLITTGLARPDQVLVLAPSRRAATAIGDHVHARLGGGLVLTATSFHALGLTILRRYYHEAGYRRPPRILDTTSQFHSLRTMLDEEDSSLWPHHPGRRSGSAMHMLAYDAVMGSAENGLEGDELRHRLRCQGLAELEDLAGFVVRYRERHEQAGVVDFGEILAKTVAVLSLFPHVADNLRQAYPYVLVDEFEQASFAQAEILRHLVDEQTDLLVAGDPAQAINGYRSGSPSYLQSLAACFGAEVIVSQDNHRSSPRLGRFLSSVRPSSLPANAPSIYEAGAEEVDARLNHRREDGDRALIVLRPFAYQAAEARWVAEEVESRLQAGVSPDRIAILFRSLNAPIAQMVTTELRQRRIGHAVQVSGRLLGEPLVMAVVPLLRYLQKADAQGEDEPAGSTPVGDNTPGDAGQNVWEAFVDVLRSPLAGLPPFGFTELKRAVSARGRDWASLKVDAMDDLALREPVRDAMSTFLERLGSLHRKVYWSPSSLLWEIWRVFPAFQVDALNGGKASAAYATLLDEVAGIEEQRPSLGLEQLIDLFDRGYFDRLTVPPARQAGVVLTTVHQAKGGEWDIVFLPGLNEGTFPLRRGPLDPGPFLARDLFAGSDPDETLDPVRVRALVETRHLEEERRVFYVAASRARRALYLSYGRLGADGSSVSLPSRFLDQVRAAPEVQVVPSDGEEGLPVNVEEAVSYYRRLLGGSDRLTQAQALYTLDALRRLYPDVVRPAQWWDSIRETAGAAPAFPAGKLYLSASRLGLYRDCPLGYQFAHHWRLGEADKPAKTMGTILHAVLEEYHQVGSALPRTREALEECLDRHFDEAAFPYRPIARQARLVLGQMLDKYFGRYGQGSGTIATERRFAYYLAPHKVNGVIDRIDRLPEGTLELIDYKTGHQMSKAEAALDLQLALYDLAFYHDADLRALGLPARVSYLYPREIGPRAEGKRTYEPTDESREQLTTKIGYFARAILAERFPSHRRIAQTFPDLDPVELERAMRKDPCRFCGWTWICPEQEREATGGE